MISSWLAPSATLCAAIIAALFAYRNNVRLHESQERLKWINAQLGDFYGPLYSLSEASTVAWRQFRTQVRPAGGYLFDYDLTEDERREWIHWMKHVLMPANRRIYEIIVSRSHLLVGAKIPDVYSQFCVHVSTYEVILHRWEQGDESVINSPIRFPEGFRDSISNTFLALKLQQQELLKQVEPGRGWRFRAR